MQDTFAERLRDRLYELDMRAAELARRAGVSKDAVSSYTTGRSIPQRRVLAAMARALRCKSDDLLTPEMRRARRHAVRLWIPRECVAEVLALIEQRSKGDR